MAKVRLTSLTPFTSYRRRFCDVLRKTGYETRSTGNYVIANNGKETVTFYFAAHNPRNRNYLVSAVLENEVNYYAFYDNSNNSVYLVGYGIVRKYCKNSKQKQHSIGSCGHYASIIFGILCQIETQNRKNLFIKYKH